MCPIADTYCFGSLDSTVTVTETAGVGGRVDNVDFTVRDALLGIELTTLHLSTEDIKAKAGTNRIEPMGKLAVRPIVEGYPVKKDIPRPIAQHRHLGAGHGRQEQRGQVRPRGCRSRNGNRSARINK